MGVSMKNAFLAVMLLLFCSVSGADIIDWQSVAPSSDALSIDGSIGTVISNISATLNSQRPGEAVLQTVAGMMANSAAALNGSGYSWTGGILDQLASANSGATAQNMLVNTGVNLNGTGAVNAAFSLAGIDIAIGPGGFSGSGLFVGTNILAIGINGGGSQTGVLVTAGQTTD
jgi:hypothetical protein